MGLLKKRFRLLLMIMMLCLVFAAGCEKKVSESEKGGNKQKNLGDTPWNHGFNAIMETEDGYYSNLMDEQHLCYYDKPSGNCILLCNKPECVHDGGKDCEATYGKLQTINTILYDGWIYFLGVENKDHIISVDLYRGAIDGSSVDKIGNVISADNLKDQEAMIFNPRSEGSTSFCNDRCAFIIHKGYAYIPYYLRLGQGMIGFQGGGLLRMDVRTGEKKILYEAEHANSDTPVKLVGAGEYVYFELGYKEQRYVISEDRIETCAWKHTPQSALGETEGTGGLLGEIDPSMLSTGEYQNLEDLNPGGGSVTVTYNEGGSFETWHFYTAEKMYEYQGGELRAYDAKTMEILPEETAKIDLNLENADQKAILCGDTLLIADTKKVYFYDLKGNPKGEIKIPTGVKTHKDALTLNILDYKINDGKVYLINRYVWPSHQWFRVFVCELEDIFQGRGEWKEAYVIRGIDGREPEEGEEQVRGLAEGICEEEWR